MPLLTELEIWLGLVSTKMSRLRRWAAEAFLEPRVRNCYTAAKFMHCLTAQKLAGLMPHPERASESMLGSADGKWIFESIFAALQNKPVAKAA